MDTGFSLLILPVILLIAPIVLSIASRQDSAAKQMLRYVLQISLATVLALGLLNWETQTEGGRSAYMLALDFQSIYLLAFIGLSLFLIISLQIKSYKFDLIAAVGNILITILFFAAAITISGELGKPIISPAIITAALMVLVNNVLVLALVNRDKNLVSKYPFSKEAATYAKKHNLKQTKLQKTLTWILFGGVLTFIAAMLLWRSLGR